MAIIFKCYKCGSTNIEKDRNYCNECKDITKFTRIETED